MRQTLSYRAPRSTGSCFFPALLLSVSIVLAGCSGGSGNAGNTKPAPAPVVTSVSPATVPAGSEAFTLAVTGTNFEQLAVVNWNKTALATTYVSSSALNATVPATLAAIGSVGSITVTNPDGQVSTAGSVSEQVAVTNPVPTLTGVAPTPLYAGSPDTSFMLTGTNFNSASSVLAGTTPLATTLVNATQLNAVAPAALLASAGSLSLSVANPAPGGGSSQAISVTLLQPPAELISLSPASAVAGSQDLLVTMTGRYFTPTAVVYLTNYNYSPVASTFVSSTSIQFTLPAQLLASAGNLSVSVRDAASGDSLSNQLTFAVVNPVPVLNGISPGSVTAGAPNFTLTLTGSNFLASSMILINGLATQSTSYFSSNSASIFIPASAVSAVGTVTVAVSNPAPGGGMSAIQTLHVISANNRIRTVNVDAADLGWDSAHHLVLASTLSDSATNPNSIVAIDPLQGTVTTAQVLPSQPAGISVTDDGSYVYVTLPITGQIERLTLPSLTPDITFSLGNNSNGLFYSATAVAAAPAQPHTVAITRHSSDTTPYGSQGGVVIYDDGVARTNIALPSGFDNFYDALTWGSDATTLYGSNAAISGGVEDTFSVDRNGVTLTSGQGSVLGDFDHTLVFDKKTSHLVDGYGNVVNAATGQYAGQLQVQNTITYEQNPFALDATQRTAFFLNVNGFYTDSYPDGTYIQAFNLDQFNYINSMLVDGLNGGSTIIRWGTSGLAINGSSQIYLIDGSFVAPAGIASAVGSYVAPSPTLTSISPVAVTAGSADVQVTLTGRDFTQASEVNWNNQNLLLDSISDTQLVVTIPASSLNQAVASGITVSNGPGSGSSNSVAFTVLPDLGANAQINVLDISGQDLVWDKTRNLLYVAVPLSDPSIPNSIAVVDLTKLSLNQTVPIADQPSALSLSDDGQYLYSGFYGQAIVQRYALPSFSLDLTIPTGVGTHSSCTFPVDVKVAPGNPQSIAVAQGNLNLEPRGCGDITIYDNAAPRSVALMNHDLAALAWGADATTLFAQADNGISPQSLSSLAVSPSGVSFSAGINYGGLGVGVHFDPGTKLLYSDSGAITDPVSQMQVGMFSAGGLVVTDSGLQRAYVLVSSGSSNYGQNTTSYTLDIFDLNTKSLLNSIVIPNVLGNPTRMARWGSNGIVFVTAGPLYTSGSAGALYVLQGSSVTGTPSQ